MRKGRIITEIDTAYTFVSIVCYYISGIPFELLRWAERNKLEILAEVNRAPHYPKFRQYIDGEKSSPTRLFEKIASIRCIVRESRKIGIP